MQTTQELLSQYAAIMEELRARKVIRSSNNPVADYTELLVVRALGLKQSGRSQKGYDAVGSDGTRVQIKGRRLTAHNRSRQLSSIRNMKDRPFDQLAGVIFSPDFTVLRAALVPHETVLSHSRYVAHTNAWAFILRDEIWVLPDVRDITTELREAQQ